MRIGLVAPVPTSSADAAAIDAIAEAEREGYEAIWLAPGDGPDGGALLCAAALAQSTERARIGLAGLPVAGLHPLRLAEDLAMIDIVSGGRLDWVPTETRRGPSGVLGEVVDIVLMAWRGEPFAHDGARFAFPEVVCLPEPEQQPHPMLWLPRDAAVPEPADPAAIGRWAEQGDAAGGAAECGRSALLCELAMEAPDDAPGTRLVAGDAAACRSALDALCDGGEPDWLFVSATSAGSDPARARDARRRFIEAAAAR